VATSWYSYDVSAFTYLIRLNSHFTGPLTTVRGSSGSARRRNSSASGGPSAIYRWQGALIFVQVRLWVWDCIRWVVSRSWLAWWRNGRTLGSDVSLSTKLVLLRRNIRQVHHTALLCQQITDQYVYKTGMALSDSEERIPPSKPLTPNSR